MSDRCLPILVHKFYKDRWVTSHVAEHKGADEWATKVAAQDILLSGLKDFVYKSDGERSIVALKHEVVRKLRRDVGPIGVQFEGSGVGESQGNAVVERAIWEIESMTRTLVHAAQNFHDVKLELTHPVRIFAVEYSAQFLNRAQRAVKDNRTAYELRKGRPYKRKLPPFAEAVMYLRVAEKRMRQKFEDRWNTGIYLCLVERSNMVLVGTPNGVVKVNCIKRLPMNQAKDPELLKSIRGYPWRLTPGDVQNEPGEVPTPWSPASRSCRRMSCHRVCRESGRQKLHPGGCTSGETLSCGSTASRRAAEAVWLQKLATRPRTTRRRADGASNLPWRQMMLNERGSRRINERVRRLEPPDSHELGVLRTSQSVRRLSMTTMRT